MTTIQTRDPTCDICGSPTWERGRFALGKTWCCECWTGTQPAPAMPPNPRESALIADWLRPLNPQGARFRGNQSDSPKVDLSTTHQQEARQ